MKIDNLKLQKLILVYALNCLLLARKAAEPNPIYAFDQFQVFQLSCYKELIVNQGVQFTISL